MLAFPRLRSRLVRLLVGHFFILDFGSISFAQTPPDRSYQTDRLNAETLIKRLEGRIERLETRIDKMEKSLGRFVGYGTFNDQGISSTWFRRAGDHLEFETLRPGMIVFKFIPPLEKKPTVIAMPLGRWAGVPIEGAKLLLDDVNEKGFIISTYDGADRANVEFAFVITRGD
jgi:hypothetical protein